LREQCENEADIANICQEGLKQKLENVFKSLIAFFSNLCLVVNLWRSHETPFSLEITQGRGTTFGNQTTQV
jgi:hypothetical protein